MACKRLFLTLPKQRHVILNLAFGLLCLFVIVDMMNGFMIRNGFPSISVFLKGGVLLLILSSFYRDRAVLIALASVSAISTIHFLSNESVSRTLVGVDWLLQSVAILIYYNLFTWLSANKGKSRLIVFCFVSFGSLMLNMLLGVIGVGYYQYSYNGSDFGVKGLLYSGNEASVLILSLTFLGACLSLHKRKIFQLCCFLGLGFASSLLLFTKASILGVFSLVVLFLGVFLKERLVGFHKKNVLVVLSLLAILVVVVGGGYFVKESAVLFLDRLHFIYERHGLLSTLFSNRDKWAIEALSTYKELPLVYQLFGSGVSWRELVSFDKPVEIDIVDYLMMYGAVGVLLVVLPVCYLAKKIFLNFRGSFFAPFLAIYLILLLGISFLAGHVFYSGVAGPSIAACFSLMHYAQETS